MEERIFKKVMLPVALIALCLFFLPDFALKIPLGLLLFMAGSVISYFLREKTADGKKKELDIYNQ